MQAADLLATDIGAIVGSAPGKPSITISAGQFNYVVVVWVPTAADGNAFLEQVENGKGARLLGSISDTAPDMQLNIDNRAKVVPLKQTSLSKPDAAKLLIAVWSAVYPIAIGISSVIRYIIPSAPPYVNMAIMTGILVQ